MNTKTLLTFLLGAGLIGTFFPAAAQNATTLQGRNVSLQIVSDTNGPLPIYNRYLKNYVPGSKGERYSLFFHNSGPRRVLAVFSIDGVNIVTGQNASINQQGYVVQPGQTARIDGWRKSNQEVARFYFSSPSESYAGRTGRNENIGIIGVAVFEEANYRPAPRVYSSQQERAASSKQGAVAGEIAAAPSLGTGHGEREYSYVNEIAFERARNPFEVFSVEYDTWRSLEDRGIIPREQRLHQRNPFPMNNYVPDPPRWR